MGKAIGTYEKTETNRGISLDIFRVWFSGYSKYVKEFDTSKDKDALMDEVLEKILAGEICTLKDFSESAFKSFYKENKEDAARFVGLKTNNIAINTALATREFFAEKLGIPVDEESSSYDKTYKAIAKIFADELEKRGEKYLYVDKMTSSAKSNFHYYILHEFANRGVDITDLDRRKFLALPERTQKDMSKSQDFYLNQYTKILEDVVRNFVGLRTVFSQYGKAAELQEFWSIVGEAVKGIELNLNEKAKQDKKFVAAKKEMDTFFRETLENIYQKRTREGRFGIFCAEIQDIVKKLKKEDLSADECNTLRKFLLKAQDVNEALKVQDNQGKNYPLNYFVIMPIAPDACARILADLVKIGKFNPDTLRLLDETKMLIRRAFFMGVHSFSDTAEDLEVVFKPFRCTIQKDGKYLDTSSDEGFEKALNLGKEYIEKYNLPKSKLCYTALAREIFSVDRRDPVCLPDSLESKYLREKTI